MIGSDRKGVELDVLLGPPLSFALDVVGEKIGMISCDDVGVKGPGILTGLLRSRRVVGE